MNDPADDAVPPHLAKLLDQHLLGDPLVPLILFTATRSEEARPSAPAWPSTPAPVVEAMIRVRTSARLWTARRLQRRALGSSPAARAGAIDHRMSGRWHDAGDPPARRASRSRGMIARPVRRPGSGLPRCVSRGGRWPDPG